MHDDRVEVERRVARLLAERLRPAQSVERVPCTLTAWAVPGEPVPFAVAREAEYVPIAPGEAWGPPWSTLWLAVRGSIPSSWAGTSFELQVDLGFDASSPGFQVEGLAFDAAGRVLKSIAPRTAHLPAALLGAGPGESVHVYVEAAANPPIGQGGSYRPTDDGRRTTAGTGARHRLGPVELVRCDETVRALVLDVEVLLGLAAVLGGSEPRQAEIVRALSAMADAIDLDDVAGTAPTGRAALRDVLAAPAARSAHHVVATGHAHIDSAWLWPWRETIRKCARTFANVLALGDDYPELVFACSQAQQYAWVREHYPELFARIRARVAAGRFVPVGGTWVEPDGNLCGGEALVRQLVLGRRFFLDEFGLECPEVWLPDSFGYSAAWPQIARLAGASYFLTQKLSWNKTNSFPHSTFLWEGIDGTQIFTHFPPVATYNSELSPAELDRASRGFAEHGRARSSLVPFGYGDGGGGPTREMLERARRQRDLEGSPRVELGTPAAFFAAAEAEYADPPVWSGELYLEMHRGTYTSQAGIKRGNRQGEHRLREAELWASAAAVLEGAPYPYDALRASWEELLLLQFHDILPGSSIGWVNDEALAAYRALEARLTELIETSVAVLVGPGSQPLALNAGPLPVDGVPAGGIAPEPDATGGPVTVLEGAEGVVLDNGVLRVTLDRAGLIASLVDLVAGREVVAPGARANVLQLHPDQPNEFDAWDIDAFYAHRFEELEAVEALTVTRSADAAVVEVRRTARESTVVQRLILRAGARRLECATEVDWHEHERLLKLAFPLDLRARSTCAEIQFGHIERPLTTNTSWDAARFEVCGHRFVHVAEAGYGVALANDSTYGHDAHRSTRDDGATTTTVRLSLLRAPRFPDPAADHGRHRFTAVLAPGADLAGAVAEGYRLNLPLRPARGARTPPPLVVVDDGGRGAVIVEAVKLADDRSGDVVVRLYEALGGRAAARVTVGFAVLAVERVDLLERSLVGAPLGASDGPSVQLELRPFEICTLRWSRPAGP